MSYDGRFTNGTWVKRFWTDDSGELLASFQYEGDAIKFARAKVAEQDRPTNVYIVTCNTLNGSMTVHRYPAEASVSPASSEPRSMGGGEDND